MAAKKEPTQDISGQIFGKWEVIEYIGSGKWLCKCLCGRTKQKILTYRLTHNKTTMCRLCIDDMQRQPKINMVEQIIGQYTVLRAIGGGSYECRCSCGNLRNVKGFNLRTALANNHNIKCDECSYKEKLDDLTDKYINDWHVLEYIGDGKYLCECKCKDKHIIQGKTIKSGASKSCRKCGCKKMISTRLELYNDTCTNIKQARTIEQIEAVQNKYSLINFITNNFLYKPKALELSKLLGISECMTLRIVHKLGVENFITINDGSVAENELYEFIKDNCNNYNIIRHDRKILNGKEIDIYIPEKKLAIEFDGNYWHSEFCKDSKYHQQKTIELAKEKIRLIHIFEYEWNDSDKQIKIKDMLLNLLNDTKEIIYARQTEIKEISNNEAAKFLELHHLQGSVNSPIRLGCFYKNELVGVMTFGKPRFNNNYQYELHRLCWKGNIRVVGGIEKIFEYFKRNYNIESVISYVNIAKFTGNSYLKIGFKVDTISNPNYIWINTSKREILTRYQTQKHKLIELGLGNTEDTEDEIMHNLGYYKIYDSGNLVMTYNRTVN